MPDRHRVNLRGDPPLGAALPLLILGLLSREALLRWRGRLMTSGRAAKAALGIGLIASGALVLSGADKALETAILAGMPGWLVEATTRY